MRAVKYFFLTWLVILLLNQILIFSACFAPYCLLVALPHTGVIAFFIVRVFLEQKRAEDGETNTDERKELDALLEPLHPPLTETVANEETSPAPTVAPTVSERIEGGLNSWNEGMEKFNKKLETFNVTLTAKSVYDGEKSFVETMIKISEQELQLREKLKDPNFAKIYTELIANWDDDSKVKPSPVDDKPEERELANYILPEKYGGAENIIELESIIAGVVDNHQKFLKETKLELDRNPDLMAIFEEKIQENGGKKILSFLNTAYPKETIKTPHASR